MPKRLNYNDEPPKSKPKTQFSSEQSTNNLSEEQEELTLAPPYDSENYEASGVKRSLHGIAFQWKILMFLAHRCHEKKYLFKLATEMDAAEKFDDVVLWYKIPGEDAQHSIFIQAKHIQIESEEGTKITLNDLMIESDERFSLQKYFTSFQKIMKQQHGQIPKFYIYTNIGFDFDESYQDDNLIKKLRSEQSQLEFYFEPLNTKEELLNYPGEDAKSYKLVFRPNTEGRQNFLNKMKELFEKTSDSHKLCETLADFLVNGKKIDLKNELLKTYRNAISKFIIDVNYKNIKVEFIIGKNLSPEVALIRDKLRSSIEVLAKIPEVKNDNESNLTTYMKNINVNMSPEYQKIFIPYSDVCLDNPKELGQEFTKIINKKKNIGSPTFSLLQNGPNQNEIINKQLPKLAGHVLVKGQGEKTFVFSNKFLDDVKLSSSLKDFRKELLGTLKLNKHQKPLDRLKNVSFTIANFQTCEEGNELEELLQKECPFPKHEISEQEVENFLNCLIFAVTQPNEKKLDKIISKKMGWSFNLVNADFITHDFEHKILDWLKQKQGIYFSNKDTKEFFRQQRQKLSQLILIGPTSEYTKKMSSYGIQFSTDNIDKKLSEFLSNTNTTHIFSIVVDSYSVLLGSIKVNQILSTKKDKEIFRGSYIFVKLSTLVLLKEEVLPAYENESNDILIVECDDENVDGVLQLYDMLENALLKKKLIIIGVENNSLIDEFKKAEEFSIDEEKICLKFTDLIHASQQKMLDTLISFQGKDIKLKELIGCYSNLIPFLIIEDLIREIKFEIGKPLPITDGYDESYYVERKLNLFVTVSHGILDNIALKGILSSTGLDLEKNTFLCVEKRPEGDKWFKHNWLFSELWRKLKNDTQSHIKVKVPYSQETFEICLKHKLHNVILISDIAGMGKSTVITHLSREIKERHPSHWVVRIDLNDHCNIFKDLNQTNIDVVELLTDNLLKLRSKLEKELFQQFLLDKKVIIMMDGFDEISPSYEDVVMNIIKKLTETAIYQIWITTRPHLSEKLVKNLDLHMCTLEPFTETDQLKFLIEFWRQKNAIKNKFSRRLETFGKALIKRISKSISDKDEQLMGIPLQTRLIAEIYAKEAENFSYLDTVTPELPQILSLHDIYKKFIELKYDIYQEEKLTTKTSNQAAIDTRDRDFKFFTRHHQFLAMYAILSKEDADKFADMVKIQIEDINQEEIARFGIVKLVNEKPQFIHRTFAEYYLVLFLMENSEKELVKEFLLKNVLWQRQYWSLRKFLNSIPHLVEKKLDGSIFQNSNNYNEIFNKILNINADEKNTEILLFSMNCMGQNKLESLLLNDIKTAVIVYDFALESKNQSLIDIVLGIAFQNDIMTHNLKDNLFIVEAKHGNVQRIKLFLECNANVNAVNRKNETPLFYAAEEGRLEIVKILLDHNANVNAENINGETPLHFAARSGQTEVVHILLQYSADVNAYNNEYETVLQFAVSKGSIETVEALLEGGAEVDESGYEGISSLKLAVIAGHTAIVQALLKKDADPEIKDNSGETALYWAIAEGHSEVVRILCQFKADVNKENFVKETPLHLAAFTGQLDIVNILLKYGANVDKTVLHEAVKGGNKEVIRILLEKNVEVNATDYGNMMPLHRAAQIGVLEAVKLLLKYKANVNAMGNGETPLHYAARNGHYEIMKILILHKADINLINGENETVLHLAARSGQLESVNLLLQHGANVNAVNKKNEIPLFSAANQGHVEIVKILLQHSENENAMNTGNEMEVDVTNDNAEPMDVDVHQDELEVVKIFLNNFISENAKDSAFKTPLHTAVFFGSLETVEILLKHGANVDAVNDENETPLHWATGQGHLDIVKVFLKHRPDLDVFSHEHKTPMNLAEMNGHSEIVEVLKEYQEESDDSYDEIYG